MGPNGVSHQLVDSHVGAVANALRWLSFVPRLRGSHLPVVRRASRFGNLGTQEAHRGPRVRCNEEMSWSGRVGGRGDERYPRARCSPCRLWKVFRRTFMCVAFAVRSRDFRQIDVAGGDSVDRLVEFHPVKGVPCDPRLMLAGHNDGLDGTWKGGFLDRGRRDRGTCDPSSCGGKPCNGIGDLLKRTETMGGIDRSIYRLVG